MSPPHASVSHAPRNTHRTLNSVARHAEDRDLLVAQAVAAIEHTASGNHVNLVTHGDHGHPSDYLYPELAAAFGDDVEWGYVERCGCGGHVTRVA